MQAKEEHYYTPEKYLELETAATFRSEYYNGQIIPMAGGTPNHNRIALNLSSALNFTLKRQPYDIFMSDMRLWIPSQRLYTYPDVMVIAGPLEFAQGRKDIVTNPIAIAEILSESTEKYDRIGKFKLYRSIPTLKEYILISQTEIYAEQYSKTETEQWLFSTYEGENAVLELSSIPFQTSLIDLYDKVNFD
ncbi:MAG: Uma2 family endonuclease [Scytonema sp. PMC 1070.18]|nr:Uma2 family endonuclease [Scytonema sp. PMC 1070.18]